MKRTERLTINDISDNGLLIITEQGIDPENLLLAAKRLKRVGGEKEAQEALINGRCTENAPQLQDLTEPFSGNTPDLRGHQIVGRFSACFPKIVSAQ